MAVCTDIGAPHDVHPTNKKLVGERIARWALRHQYHLNNQESGPLPIKAVYQNGQITVHFKYIAKKLTTLDSTPLLGFFFDGIQEIQASTDGLRVYIQSPIKHEFLYYGWKPFSDANLCNSENLPASTFKIPVQ
jgi:sialate O-acetylesterase